MVQRCDSETSASRFARGRVTQVTSVTCNAAGLTPLARATRIQSAIDGFTCHALGPVEDQSYGPRVGAHLSVPRMLLGLWDRHRRVATGLASGGMPAALHVTDDTARHLRYTSRAKREADVSLSHRCTMEHPVAPWSTTMRRVLPTPRQTRES